MRFKPGFIESFKLGFLSLIFTGIMASSGVTISPSLVEYRDDVRWSRVQYSPNGTCVFDRHNPEGNRITSSWCEDGIYISYQRIWTEQTGTRTVTRYHQKTQQVKDKYVCEVPEYKPPRSQPRDFQPDEHRRQHYNSQKRCRWTYKTVQEKIPYTDTEPVYVKRSEFLPVRAIEFNPRGKTIRYQEGEPSEVLKEFMTSLPNKNQWVTLILENGQYVRYEIGKKTVAAWKSVY